MTSGPMTGMTGLVIDAVIYRRLRRVAYTRVLRLPIGIIAAVILIALAVVLRIAGWWAWGLPALLGALTLGFVVVSAIVYDRILAAAMPLRSTLQFGLMPGGLRVGLGPHTAELEWSWFSRIEERADVVMAYPRGARSRAPLIWPRELLSADQLETVRREVDASARSALAAP